MRIQFALALILVNSAVLAQPHDESPCTDQPEAKWQPFSAALKKVEDQGNVVKNAEVHHKCYEVRGKTKDGKRFEWIMNPITLETRDAKK